MEYQCVIKCPHCGKQQSQAVENATGEVTCESESCGKKFWIATSRDLIIHTHPDKESADKFSELLKKDSDPFSKYECPHCGKPLAVRNYAQKTARVIDNHCCKVIYLVVGFNNDIRVHEHVTDEVSIFSENFGAEAAQDTKEGQQ